MDSETLLDFLRSRVTVRSFEDRPIPREKLVRVLEAATRAPSPINRQPWRFSVVTSPSVKRQIAEATQEAIAAVRRVLAQRPNPDHMAGYWDFFVKPLQSAAAFVVVQYRTYPDTIANLVANAGGDPQAFITCAQWQSELSAASAATMQLLLQAHAEGLGACWMGGPVLGRDRIGRLLGFHSPWRMLCGVALGWPAERPAPLSRKPLEKVVDWFEEAPAADATQSAF